jgi:hypothetical protein
LGWSNLCYVLILHIAGQAFQSLSHYYG